MTVSNKLESITDQLGKLHGYAYFRPQPGPLRERLTQAALEALEGEYAEELSEGAFDLEVNIGCQEGDGELTLGFKINHPMLQHSSHLALDALDDQELDDLGNYLARLGEQPAPVEAPAPAKTTIVRKGEELTDFHEKGPAAARLKVTPEWLKSVIPCTDYTYEEIDGKKYIRDYYWSKELIEKLVRIKSTKTTPEDLQYVAKECCEGDLDWAKDLIARLKSPNRPEPAPKAAQQQRGDGRQQNRPGAAKIVQGKTVHAKAQVAKPAPGKAPLPRPAGGNVPNPASGNVAGGNPAQAQAKAPGERGRSRSRHRRPFRQQGNDGGRKPESAAGDKPPQQ